MYLKIGNFITKEDPSSTVNLVSVMVSEALHLCPLKKFDPTANPLLLSGISKELCLVRKLQGTRIRERGREGFSVKKFC